MESTHVPDPSEIAVYLGLDVGKGEHHAVALAPSGKTLHDKALPNSEPRLRGLLTVIHPHLERILGPRIHHPAVLELLTELRSPAGIQAAGKDTVAQLLRRRTPRMHRD